MKRIAKGILVGFAVVAPVRCSNAITYGSACIAACAGATSCVPTGGGSL